MKSVEDKTWNIFNVDIHEKSISVLEDRTWAICFCPELGTTGEIFSMSTSIKMYKYPDRGVSYEKCGGQNIYIIFSNFESTKKIYVS